MRRPQLQSNKPSKEPSVAGTLVVQRDLAGAKEKDWVKARLDGVAGDKVRGRSAVEVSAAPGSHQLQVSLGGFRTNTITIDVVEGRRHLARVLPTALGGLLTTPLLGVLPVLLGLTWPGSVYRLHVE